MARTRKDGTSARATRRACQTRRLVLVSRGPLAGQTAVEGGGHMQRARGRREAGGGGGAATVRPTARRSAARCSAGRSRASPRPAAGSKPRLPPPLPPCPCRRCARERGDAHTPGGARAAAHRIHLGVRRRRSRAGAPGGCSAARPPSEQALPPARVSHAPAPRRTRSWVGEAGGGARTSRRGCGAGRACTRPCSREARRRAQSAPRMRGAPAVPRHRTTGCARRAARACTAIPRGARALPPICTHPL
jgi:hypothetical protein